MKPGLSIKNGIIIPEHELEITASRAGGPGGQHVNKTSSRITIRWNIYNTTAFSDKQKELLLQNLQSEITSQGDLLIHDSSSRSQRQNRAIALQRLAEKIRKALYVPKKRIKHIISKAEKERRAEEKKRHSFLKQKRRNPFEY
jgi:ribosome-associated protein